MGLTDEVRAATRWRQSHGEELANGITHGLGLIAAAIGAPFLLRAAASHASTPFLIGTIVFVGTMLFLYLGSAVYHSWPRTPFKAALQVVDHSAIFLLIAGTYTPFTLGPLRGPWGWTMLGIVWALALYGVILKASKGAEHRPRLAVALYLAMGWLVLFVIRPIAHAVPTASLLWLIGGGVVYTLGVIFFVNDRKRYWHSVWHLFVLGGTGCHYFAILTCAT